MRLIPSKAKNPEERAPIIEVTSKTVAVGQVWDLEAANGPRRITVVALQMGPFGRMARATDSRGRRAMVHLSRLERSYRCTLVTK